MGFLDKSEPTNPAGGSPGQQQQQGHYPQLPVTSSPPPGGVFAPGGYQVLNPAVPPAELPTPFIDAQRHTSCCQPGHKKQQQQGSVGHVALQPYGSAGVCVGQPVQPSGSCSHQQAHKDKDCCRCTVGWLLYGLGWIFPLCWVGAMILPCVTKDRGDKRAALASGITLALLIAVIVAIVVIVGLTGR